MREAFTKHLNGGKALMRGLGGRTKTMATATIVTLGMATGSAVAEPVFEPADLGDIVFPIELGSIGIAVGTAGAAMIGIWALYAIGFKLVRKFIRRMGAAV